MQPSKDKPIAPSSIRYVVLWVYRGDWANDSPRVGKIYSCCQLRYGYKLCVLNHSIVVYASIIFILFKKNTVMATFEGNMKMSMFAQGAKPTITQGPPKKWKTYNYQSVALPYQSTDSDGLCVICVRLASVRGKSFYRIAMGEWGPASDRRTRKGVYELLGVKHSVLSIYLSSRYVHHRRHTVCLHAFPKRIRST